MSNAAPAKALESVQQKLALGALSEAGAIIDELWSEFSDDPNLGYLKALLCRLANNPSDAIAVLTGLVETYPEMARAHQEIALNSLSLNEPEAALAAERVALDASLLKSWELPNLYRAFSPENSRRLQIKFGFLTSLRLNYAR